MIPFQQILDTTRTAGEICCPGHKYWFFSSREKQTPCDILTSPCAQDHGSLHPLAPGVKINPKDGSYNFYTGSQLYSHHNSRVGPCQGKQGAFAVDRNGKHTFQQQYLDPLSTESTDKCGCPIEGWSFANYYYIDGDRVVQDGCSFGQCPCSYQGNMRYASTGQFNCFCTVRRYNPVWMAARCGMSGLETTSQSMLYCDTQTWGWRGYEVEGEIPASSYMGPCANPAVGCTRGRPEPIFQSGFGYHWSTGSILYGEDDNPHILRYGVAVGGCCCCCCGVQQIAVAMSEELHPEKQYEAFTTNCGTTCCICRSYLHIVPPQTNQWLGNCYNTWPQNYFITMARKTPDIASSEDGLYIAIVSNQRAKCNNSSSFGTGALFCQINDTCFEVNSCPKYIRPNGIVYKMDLPTWDGTSSGHCWVHSGKTWYMHNNEILGKCVQLSVKDLYFRDNKIIVKPITYAGNQECFCCHNGATAHPTVVFCECNCNVRYLSFTSINTNSPVVADMIYTTRNTWVTATPTYNASWSADASCSTPPKAYGGITLAEWSEDWTTCYGAVDLCNSSCGSLGFENGGMSEVGRRSYCCDYTQMADFELGYDYYDDSLILSWSGAGGCCCYSSQQMSQSGIQVVKVPADMSVLCHWVKKKLELAPTNLCCAPNNCTVCSNYGNVPTCFWSGAFGNMNCWTILKGGTYGAPPGFACFIPKMAGIAEGYVHGANYQTIWFNTGANPLVSVTCVTMQCCTLNPNCWMRGCDAGWYCCGCICDLYHSALTQSNKNCYMHCCWEFISTTYCSSCFSTTPQCYQSRIVGHVTPFAGTSTRHGYGRHHSNCPNYTNSNFIDQLNNHKFGYTTLPLFICDYT